MQIQTDKSLETAHQAREIPQEAFDWYDEYAHGLIDRREFMRRLTGLVALGFTMSVLTSALLPNYALAEQVSFNDPKIKATYVEFDSPKGHGKGRGYLVMPTEIKGNLPAVLVVHENRGLNPYIEDVTRRLAMNGFIAFAPDALYPLGGYPGNDDDGRAMQSSMDKAKIEEDFIAAALFLKAHPSCSGKLGAVGFCFGGYVVNMLAATIPDKLDAGVPFYGTPAAESLRNNVKGPLLIHFAELDQRVNASWPDYEKVLQANKVPYEAIVYPGVNHGFHNDSTARYNEEAAESAWGKTLIFFDTHLS
ncbi:dienelactone hydrolase family protein [Vibrio fluvialis]|jgi:carboxymethylenebutenolidase|uniref:dienelactone hydrolase family protein n=1 Tax=Vibrio fluvialis TaxID=676 RepID=UPI00130221DA|nr:dienelactone hydrolase family protein [Vibrio fluvialis]ELS8949755.1 dienelactone hydrolase family protein [Vibrio fluvialis]EMA8959543.1 dienelactone hydrolase family protein [Vibrio fluvialis]EMA8960427.1 dienelactone hydrolase family protein [Vibrio fluvialis]MBY7789440.1 dienelactone hydrolase family protein [Vibrio fluvialis]MBY7983083.1 dienelactone hydrolase family protein [Vibrio fluvialis]